MRGTAKDTRTLQPEKHEWESLQEVCKMRSCREMNRRWLYTLSYSIGMREHIIKLASGWFKAKRNGFFLYYVIVIFSYAIVICNIAYK